MSERKGREAWPPELTEQLRKVDKLRRSGRYGGTSNAPSVTPPRHAECPSGALGN